MDGGKFKLSEVNARAVSREQNKLVGKLKMAAGDKVSIRGQVMEYMYIPTGIKREMVRSGVDCIHTYTYNVHLQTYIHA